MKHLMYKGLNLPYPSPAKAQALQFRQLGYHPHQDVSMCGRGQCAGARSVAKCDTCLFGSDPKNPAQYNPMYAMWKRGKSKSRKVWGGMF